MNQIDANFRVYSCQCKYKLHFTGKESGLLIFTKSYVCQYTFNFILWHYLALHFLSDDVSVSYFRFWQYLDKSFPFFCVFFHLLLFSFKQMVVLVREWNQFLHDSLGTLLLVHIFKFCWAPFVYRRACFLQPCVCQLLITTICYQYAFCTVMQQFAACFEAAVCIFVSVGIIIFYLFL